MYIWCSTPKRGVAIRDAGHDDPKAIDVGHLRKAQVFEFHLLIDGVEGFFSSLPAAPDADACKCGIDVGLNFLHQVAATVARLSHGLGERDVAPGMQMAKGEVLQLTVGLIQSQAVGDRRVDFEGFGRNASPFAARHVGQRAHVVRAVCQLDQDDTYIARHGQQHLAERLGLVFFAGVELQFVEFGQSIHELGHTVRQSAQPDRTW